MSASSGWQALALGVLAFGCARSPSDLDRAKPRSPPVAALQGAATPKLSPLLPTAAKELGPLRKAPGTGVDGAALAAVDTCAGCHRAIAQQWSASAHAFASFSNPIYRTSVQMLRDAAGAPSSEVCAGCHDAALLVDGVMKDPIRPDDPRAHAGVSCQLCHGVVHTTKDGNGTYRIAGERIRLPASDDPAEIARHKSSAAPGPLRTADLCSSCHRGFLSPASGNTYHFPGIDEPSAWSRSGYAGSKTARIDKVEAATCSGCHMPRIEAKLPDRAAKQGRVASHYFAGAHTWLAAMVGDETALAEQRRMLEGALSVDVPVVRTPRGVALAENAVAITASDEISVDVVVRNLRVGHRFPGGTRDIQDSWLELTLEDASGRLIAEAGTRHQQSRDDPEAHRFEVLLADERGQPILDHETRRFRGVMYDHTIGPRDAAVVRYAFRLPDALPAQPLRLSARLRHRSRSAGMQDAVCAESRSASGREFQAATARARGKALEGCAPQPVTEIGAAELFLGVGAAEKNAGKAFAERHRRLYEHALGLLHEVQERLEDARPSLQVALAELEPRGPSPDRARVLWALGQLAGRTGRADEAQRWFDRAAIDAPDHPAIARSRGEAFAAVWRFREAVEPLRAAAESAPRDDATWAALATVAGSMGDDGLAFDAARHALTLTPRSEPALRVQSLALGRLSPDDPRIAPALAAYLEHREPDAISDLRLACQERSVDCARERTPVHTHWLRSVDRSMR